MQSAGVAQAEICRDLKKSQKLMEGLCPSCPAGNSLRDIWAKKKAPMPGPHPQVGAEQPDGHPRC
ncbi:hypothetical protein TA5114_01499 [Cognatishimia activa]|uniref:Uncharacterized protein n=1 Tax=Cognatishimia activa TaxID=1715691 RepID=A0A0P1IWU4_9RHOB|nr:hypothetical protein TA5113_01571 [Cognatishimia activa]CUK25695.1 hypothetical protein TA5114_01499 [Cognatishimia activa]